MDQHDIVIVGGGNAGISLAARLLRDGYDDIALVEPQQVHRYRPLLNYVGSGEADMASLERPMRAVVPDGCTWIEDEVISVDADGSTVRTSGGRTVGYRTLVMAPGMTEDWDATPGLREAYGDWAGSTFVVDSVRSLWSRLSSLREGHVVFTVPPEPAPCGATALKPLLMACDHWRRAGVLPQLAVTLALPGRTVTGLRKADERLERTFASYGIEVLREATVTGLDVAERRVDVQTVAGPRRLEDLAFAHVVPHYRAPRWVADSGLGDGSNAGLVDIDPHTLRHRVHQDVWSLGDAASVATRPSGGALRSQVKVLAGNIAAAREGKPLSDYDGYTVMPITTSRRRLMLVEVDRAGRPAPSTPVPDLMRPRRSTWLFDRYGLPVVYFRRILRGKV